MKREIKDTHIYFPVKLLDDIKKIAAINRRTISAEIVLAVEARVSEWKDRIREGKKPRLNPITDKKDIDAW